MTHPSIRIRYPSLVLASSLSQQHTFNDEYAFRLLPAYEAQYHRMSRVLELDRKLDLWIFEMEAMNWRCRDGEYFGWPLRKEAKYGCRREGGQDGAGLAEHVHVGELRKAEFCVTEGSVEESQVDVGVLNM